MRFGKKKERFLRALSISQTTIIGWYSALSVLPVITSTVHVPRIKTLGQKWGESFQSYAAFLLPPTSPVN